MCHFRSSCDPQSHNFQHFETTGGRVERRKGKEVIKRRIVRIGVLLRVTESRLA